MFEYFPLFSEMQGAILQVSQRINILNLLHTEFEKNLKRGMFFLYLTFSQTSMFNLSKSFKTVSHSDSLFSRLTKNFYQESENFDDNIYTHVFSAISRIDRFWGYEGFPSCTISKSLKIFPKMFGSGGGTFWGQPLGWSGEPTEHQRICENLQKILKKIAKMDPSANFSMNSFVNFSAPLVENTNCMGNLWWKFNRRMAFYLFLGNVFISARGNFSGEARSTKGGLVRGSPHGGSGGVEASDAGEVFKKYFKKPMQNLPLLKNFQANFAIISLIFLKFYRIFGENLGKYLEKFRNIHLGVRRRSPRR